MKMECIKLSALLMLLGGASASILELNGTMVRSIPPLYSLEEWSSCQAPGDVYCIVDAALVSDAPSPMLSFLQEYSKETLKHYNRTQIHRGICVSRCGEPAPTGWHSAAQHCLDASLKQYDLQATVLSVSWCSTAGEARGGGAGGRALAVLCVVLCALSALATALHLMQDRKEKNTCNKYLLAFSLKQNWQILVYDRSRPRTDDRMKDVAVIEGIRVIGMQFVIFAHVLFICVYSYVDNPEFVEKMYDSMLWKVVFNSPLWLQTFFCVSGFLTAYPVLLTESTKPITLLKCVMAVLGRWIRLTPVVGFTLWFTICWFPLLGSGPQWGWLVAREASDCSQHWLAHLLYYHNHLPTGTFCMGHTWYLSADMQLHVFGLLLLLAGAYWRRLLPVTLALLPVGAALATGLVAYHYSLLPIITAQSPELLRTTFLGSGTVSMLYIPAWTNLPGYAAGIATACLLHYTNKHDIHLNKIKWFKAAFHLAIPVGSCVAGVGALFLRDGGAPLWAGALYAALDRTLAALCVSVFLLGCVARCESHLWNMLRWRCWHPLGRLSCCVFVTHFTVLRLTLASAPHTNHVALLTMLCLLVSTSVLSYLVAVPLCLLLELPALQLWKALTDAPRPAPPASTTRPPPAAPATRPTGHKLDLLANLTRRSNV